MQKHLVLISAGALAALGASMSLAQEASGPQSGATGRSYSDEPTILRSIMSQLLTLPPETVVHTGHGESTTIGAERDGVMERAAALGLTEQR